MTRVLMIPAASPAPARPMREPVVFVGDTPDPAWAVARFSARGALDERAVWLRPASGTRTPTASALLGRTITVALPLAGFDGHAGWRTLLRGTAAAVHTLDGERQTVEQLEVRDAWSAELDRVVDAWPAVDATGAVIVAASPRLDGNRSPQPVTLPDGRTLHVPAPIGDRWSLADALDYLRTATGLDLPTPLMDRDALADPLSRAVDLARPLREVLEALLAGRSLVVCRELPPPYATEPTERRDLRPAGSGRRCTIGPHLRRTAERFDRTSPAPAGRRVELTAGPVWIEGTFTLRPHWDASLRGAADTMYHRTQSADFAAYANVFRRWVLNEDGIAGVPRFDAAARLGLSRAVTAPLPFGPCLTLDDAAQPRPVRVELSLDGGATWSPAPAPVQVLRDRGGVYLAADDLGAGVVAAGAAGVLAARATATLRSPQPRTLLRWIGNAFGDTQPPRRIDAGARFAFRRVDASSIHSAGLADGSLTADQRWDDAAFHRWAVEQTERARAGPATITVVPQEPWLGLAMHDRVADDDGGELRVTALDVRDADDHAGPRGTFTLSV